MPEKKTVRRARQALREGKRPTTAAGEFVREEVEHVRRGKHGVRSPQQAIAIGLSKARRAGVPLEPPQRGQTKEKTRRSAERAYEAGQREGELAGSAASAGRAGRTGATSRGRKTTTRTRKASGASQGKAASARGGRSAAARRGGKAAARGAKRGRTSGRSGRRRGSR